MLAKSTQYTNEKRRQPTECGGRGIWYVTPLRHWCKMTDADVAMHLLAGRKLYDSWSAIVGEYHEEAWLEGTIVIKRPDGSYESVVLDSKCRWKKRK